MVIGELLVKYYALRQQFFGVRPASFLRKNALKNIENFAAWCKNQGIEDVEGFLEFRMKCAEHSKWVPKTSQLRSNKIAEQWRNWKAGEVAQERIEQQHMRQAGSAQQQQLQALRLLTPNQELVKARYAQSGKPQLCVLNETSGGYHPESRYCPACPMALQCAGRLHQQHGFDVVSLRANRLHALPKSLVQTLVA